MYDPRLGRFLTPDPVVADPSLAQRYNRYSYVLNRPTQLVDPTGFVPEGYVYVGLICGGGTCYNVYKGRDGTPLKERVEIDGVKVTVRSRVGIAHGNVGYRRTASGRPARGTARSSTGSGKTAPTPPPKPEEAKPAESCAPECPAGSAQGRNDRWNPRGLDIDPNVFEPIGSRGRSGAWYQFSNSAIRELSPVFQRFGTDLSRARIAFDPSSADSNTVGNAIVFGRNYLDVLHRGQNETLVHEVTHVAQHQILGGRRMAWRGFTDWLRSGSGERHYEIGDSLANETLSSIDITDPRYDLEAIADQVADLAWEAGCRVVK